MVIDIVSCKNLLNFLMQHFYAIVVYRHTLKHFSVAASPFKQLDSTLKKSYPKYWLLAISVCSLYSVMSADH